MEDTNTNPDNKINIAPANQSIVDELEEVIELEKQIKEAKLPEELELRTMTMIRRLRKVAQYGYFSREFDPIAKYVSWITRLPWEKYTHDNLDLKNAAEQLDSTHYGLDAVKERIYEYIAMLNLQRQNEIGSFTTKADPNETSSSGAGLEEKVEVIDEMSRLQGSSSHAPIICLVGVQGIGKTSIAKSIGQAMSRKFIRVSLGGMAHVSELRGTSRSNPDAEPGQIIKSLIRTNVMNPLILLDEVDKVSNFQGIRSDIMASLLEILDPEQNSTYRDNFVDYPVDLSKVMFIATANNLGGISAALLDRLEIIRMSSYTDEEKASIAQKYLMPKVMKATGVRPEQIKFDEEVWPLLIRPLGFDAGIRQLERNITTIIRKVAKKIVLGEGKSFEINAQTYREYLPQDFGVYS